MIHHGDALEVMRGMAEGSVDAVVTDPPYGLTANKKGGSGVASVSLATPYGRSRIGTGNGVGGFMGLAWDSSTPQAEVWAECLRVLKPGGYLLAFAGTRTQHRMAVAIEDGGFEIRDLIAWVYGSGFPKSLNLSGDRAGWGTALKPAFEPITVARKPIPRTVRENIDLHGTGALNIDACRVGFASEDDRAAAFPAGRLTSHSSGSLAGPGAAQNSVSRPEFISEQSGLGRWPANLVHDGSEEVLDAFPDAPGQIADASSSSSSRKNQNVYGEMKRGSDAGPRRMDSGSAARFFYCAKASREDRGEGNTHPTVKPFELMRWLVRLVTPPGGLVLDPFAGSGSTGVAAVAEGFRFVGIEREAAYVAIAKDRVYGVAPLFSQP